MSENEARAEPPEGAADLDRLETDDDTALEGNGALAGDGALEGNSVTEAGNVSLDAARRDRDRDGVASMRDVEEEVGDEDEIEDRFSFDESAARELGADFPGDQRDEPRLD